MCLQPDALQQVTPWQRSQILKVLSLMNACEEPQLQEPQLQLKLVSPADAWTAPLPPSRTAPSPANSHGKVVLAIRERIVATEGCSSSSNSMEANAHRDLSCHFEDMSHILVSWQNRVSSRVHLPGHRWAAAISDIFSIASAASASHGASFVRR